MHRLTGDSVQGPQRCSGFDAVLNGTETSMTMIARPCSFALFCPKHSQDLRLTLRFMRTVTALFCLAVLTGQSLAEPSICTSYAADLNTMVQVDQAVRERISNDTLPVGKVKKSALPRIFQQMDIVDRANTVRLKKLVRACGWPRRSVHGERAPGDAWMLAQHSEPAAQREFLALLEAAVKAGEASPSDLAYLADRVSILQGHPQLYGTQLDQKSPCEFEFSPLDDRSRVNERRKSVGMPSLEEYERVFREYLSTHGCPPK